MNRLNKNLYYYAEVTIEAVSPLVLASGKSGNFFDVQLVRDANGLPAIPGTTIAGILRHAFQEELTKEDAEKIFGYQTKKNGVSSSLEVSWAYVHDSKNCIHKSFYSRDDIKNDSILNELYIEDNPDFKRDHVRLSDKGVAYDSGKFDRYFVPAGSRFTFSIGLWSSDKECAEWEKILGILFSPTFRIGAAGRAGYGCIKVVGIRVPSKEKNYFDLSKEADIKSFRTCTENLNLSDFTNEVEKINLKLCFPLGFRVGGGTKSFLRGNGRDADMLPYSERVITWSDNNGAFELQRKIAIPGSAIKGALRHRAAYHLARINKNWNWNEKDDDGLSKLFGNAANDNDSESTGQAGKVWFTDLYLNQATTYQLSRNSIDRFTGGTLNGALFQEENVGTNQVFETFIYVKNDVEKTSKEYIAFKWALDDLKAGRLALGGGSGHGLGFNYAEEGN